MIAIWRLLKSLGWIVVIVTVFYAWCLPDDHWLSYDNLYVADAAIGEGSPKITEKKAFYQPVLVRWFASLETRAGSAWATVCSANAENLKYPDQQTPQGFDVYSFFNRAPCADNLPPGDYYIDLDLNWDDVFSTREMVVESNVFHVVATAIHPNHYSSSAPVYVRPARPHRASSGLPWFLRIFTGARFPATAYRFQPQGR
jgi:hypothetical protein